MLLFERLSRLILFVSFRRNNPVTLISSGLIPRRLRWGALLKFYNQIIKEDSK